MRYPLPLLLFLTKWHSLRAFSPISSRVVSLRSNKISSDSREARGTSILLSSPRKGQSISSSSSSRWNKLKSTLSQKAAMNHANIETATDNHQVQIFTLLRVGIPSLLAGVVATMVFPGLALYLASFFNEGVFAVLSVDSSQFVQNFLTVAGLLFSILVGQTYYFMYQQQEMVYYSLFNEVTEAKSLLEQVALVCQGRSMYTKCLESISRYVQDDLKRLQSDPAVLLSSRPVDDPLESIMYMTSVGVPSTVYETVRSLRQARASRLGALQRKLPPAHMWLLWILAAIELVSFPLLGAGTQIIGGYKILTIEGVLFGVMTTGIVLTLRVVGELWRPAGGAYNVDAVLSTMVRGLESELEGRLRGSARYNATGWSPSPPRGELKDMPIKSSQSVGILPVKQQGGDFIVAAKRIWSFLRQRRRD